MKKLRRYLCQDCAKDLKEAQLIFKKIPDTEGSKDMCAWCKRKRYGAEYEILYGRKA